MTKAQKHKLINEAIRLTWSSLESHLDYTHGKSSEGTKFHVGCVKDYARVIDILSKLYEEEQ